VSKILAATFICAFAPEYRDSFAPGKLIEHLRAIREACAGLFILCSNTHRVPGDEVSSVGRRLAEMVRGR
jgi:hypothetical protein